MAQQSRIVRKTAYFLDKISTIFTSLTELLARSLRTKGSKANIWLPLALYSVKLVVLYAAVSSPLTAYAGVFSFISSFVQGKEVDAGLVPSTSQVAGVLQAHVGPAAVAPVGGGEIAIVDGSALIQEAGVIGTQADIVEGRSTRISLYVVRQGDSLSEIADMFDVTVNTIVWANNIKGSIREGDELVILPISGVSHTVAKGDTIRSIASRYKADIDDILSYNDLKTNDTLAVGSILIVPDGEVKAAPASSNTTSNLRNAGGPTYKGYYIRPIDGGSRSQGLHGYNAVDLAAPIGTPIKAAADGVVIIARSTGYNGGYGAYIVISHPNGTQTLYAHASKISVSSGDVVTRGEVIGNVGSSGKSTGPHVHFEIRGAANPF